MRRRRQDKHAGSAAERPTVGLASVAATAAFAVSDPQRTHLRCSHSSADGRSHLEMLESASWPVAARARVSTRRNAERREATATTTLGSAAREAWRPLTHARTSARWSEKRRERGGGKGGRGVRCSRAEQQAGAGQTAAASLTRDLRPSSRRERVRHTRDRTSQQRNREREVKMHSVCMLMEKRRSERPSAL